MNDAPVLEVLADGERISAERLESLCQSLMEADEADVILLGGLSQADYQMLLDQASADCGPRVAPPNLAGVGA